MVSDGPATTCVNNVDDGGKIRHPASVKMYVISRPQLVFRQRDEIAANRSTSPALFAASARRDRVRPRVHAAQAGSRAGGGPAAAGRCRGAQLAVNAVDTVPASFSTWIATISSASSSSSRLLLEGARFFHA